MVTIPEPCLLSRPRPHPVSCGVMFAQSCVTDHGLISEWVQKTVVWSGRGLIHTVPAIPEHLLFWPEQSG